VRNLAHRCASAAKEIKTLINDSVERVQSGTELVDEAGNTIQEVVSSVQRVAGIIREMSIATEGQASGIQEIQVAMVQMDQVTQQNASLVEEAAAASEALRHQAANLNELVSKFILADQPQLAGALTARISKGRNSEESRQSRMRLNSK
jgi:methyl-accepting chemotaxis protein